MAVVVASVTGGCWLLGRSTQEATSAWTTEVEDQMWKKVQVDAEARRNSQVGKVALANLFQSVGKGEVENEEYLKKDIKLPPVQWHPGAEGDGKKNSWDTQ